MMKSLKLEKNWIGFYRIDGISYLGIHDKFSSSAYFWVFSQSQQFDSSFNKINVDTKNKP